MHSPENRPLLLSAEPQYCFGDFTLGPDGTLRRARTVQPIPPKELSILRLLLGNAGKIVPSEHLRKAAWGEIHVSLDSLPRCISSLRARLGSEQCIQTVYKGGYRFNLPVHQVPVSVQHSANAAPEPLSMQLFELNAHEFSHPTRLVILPFRAVSGVPAHLGSGIAEETMLRLSRIRNLSNDPNRNRHPFEVLASDSVFALAAKDMPAREIGQTLEAHFVLAGSITALPVHYRLRAEMISVSDNVQLWVEDFLVLKTHVESAEARLAERVSARIRNSFVRPAWQNSSTPGHLKSRPDSSLPFDLDQERHSRAYSLYLESQAHWNSLQRHHMQDAVRGFQSALELEPDLTAARYMLVNSLLSLSAFGYLRGDIAADQARTHAELIPNLSPYSQAVGPALGWIQFHHDRNPAGAEKTFARFSNLPLNRWNLVYRVRFALGQGAITEAVNLLKEALHLDGYSPSIHGWLAWVLHLDGDEIAALAQARRAVTLHPDHPWTLLHAANVLAAAGSDSAAEATSLAVRLTELHPSFDAGFATLAYTQARQGRLIEARDVLHRQQWLGRERFIMRSFHVPALVELGELDAAISELHLAEEQHCPWIFELIADPRLKPLHDEREFQRITETARGVRSQDASVA